MIYGYARVSTKSQEDNTSLNSQIELLKQNGCGEVYHEVFTGATMDRPKFNELLSVLKEGDTLVVTKLDRFTRSTQEGIKAIKDLTDKGIKVNILNMGIVDLSNAMGNMMFTILTAFAEYERNCINERTKEGKQIKMSKDEDATMGRPKKYKRAQREMALKLLSEGKSYNQVADMTGISRRTLIRYKKEQEQQD
ncbi:recombinase family protein [Romboutsia sp. 1001285H_161024_C4]|uniref:recombinase family protein n=1 Tax=Romboutsia sp. 1001285H_161024_C4 TaxID=2787109 RepID=UPI00189BF211|nr:recombinase family protein [Romboutsia sp. 1001285H_161024_C4]